MQLYRVFPDLLHNRLPTQNAQFSNTTSSHDPFFPIDLDSMNMSTGFCNTSPSTTANTHSNHTHTHTSPPLSSLPNIYHQAPDDKTPEILSNNWLTEFAITTISRLKTIPLESRTRCLQPFLLVASCSELRLPPQSHSEEDESANDSTETPTVSMEAIEVSQTRRFILGRLTSFLHVLPPKPINVCLRLVKEVWKRMDRGETDAYWIDVMIEKGWETTMG